MTLKEKLDKLYQISRSDPDPARREEAFQRWHRLSRTAETGTPPVDTKRGNAPDEVRLQPGQKANLPSRINALGPSAETNNAIYQGLGRFVNGASMGASDAIIDTVAAAAGKPDTFRKGRQEFNDEHPFVSNSLSAAGSVTPWGLPARVAGVIAEGTAPLIAQIPAAARGTRALVGAAKTLGTGMAIGGMQGALEAPPGQRTEGAVQGAGSGAMFAGGLGLLGKGFGVLANGLRNGDIALLEKYGLQPSMIPGVPVKAEGAGPIEAIKNPPLGTHTAGPETRQAAGIRAAQTILPDLIARKNASSKQIGLERAGNEASGLARRPVPTGPALAEAYALMGPKETPSSMSSLGTVANRIIDRSGQAGRLSASDLQDIASLSHELANPDAYGGPDKPALRLLGRRLHDQLPAEMRDQDTRFAASKTAMERAKESLSLENTDIENPQGEPPLAAIKKAGNVLGRMGEGTKAAANADLGVSRMREEGPPEVMTGPGGSRNQAAPLQVDYGSAIDEPSLHVAQENLQLNPSAVFSGGGVKGVAHRLAGAGARRFLYPPLRAAGNGDPTRGVAPLLTLEDALRRQIKLMDEEEAGQKPVVP